MPELPDVETFRRLLGRHALRKKIARVAVRDRRILGRGGGLGRRLAGARLTASRRHGKYLFARIDRGGWLVMHFGLTGALAYCKRPDSETAFTRVRIDFAGGGHLDYSNKRMIGRVQWVPDAKGFIAKEKLGPDAIDSRFGFQAFRAALRSGQRDIKSALMDQRAMAGIGNVYSDEILYQARVPPQTPSGKLDLARLRRIHRKMRSTLAIAIRRRVSAESPGKSVPRSWLLRERKKGGRCPRCRTRLRTRRLHGRASYYCGHCQA